jgi:hypothetical protein
MSKMKQAIQALATSSETVLVYLPGRGYVLGKVERLDDDVVTIKPETGNRVVLHYTCFSIERN